MEQDAKDTVNSKYYLNELKGYTYIDNYNNKQYVIQCRQTGNVLYQSLKPINIELWLLTHTLFYAEIANVKCITAAKS